MLARGNVASEFSKRFSAHVTFRGNGWHRRRAPGAWLSDSREIRRRIDPAHDGQRRVHSTSCVGPHRFVVFLPGYPCCLSAFSFPVVPMLPRRLKTLNERTIIEICFPAGSPTISDGDATPRWPSSLSFFSLSLSFLSLYLSLSLSWLFLLQFPRYHG